MSVQSNVQAGDIVRVGNSDLSGANGKLLVLINSSGAPLFDLPSANTDFAYYLCVDGDVATLNTTARPLTAGAEVRVVLKGACNPGDQLVLADVATAADAGKVRALPSTTPGTYRVLGLAEEVGVDGQLVRMRHSMNELVTISTP